MERTAEFEQKVRDDVYGFFVDQCGIERSELNDNTNIIEDIDGDSLMFLQLLEEWKKTYNIDIEFRVIGRYLTKNPVLTIGDAIELGLKIICESEEFKEILTN